MRVATRAIGSVLALTSALVRGDDSDLITSLPGAPTVEWTMRGGYMPVGGANSGRELYYFFAGQADNDMSAPVTLWLNGGPGCSSLGGAFTELGPFYPDTDGASLRENPWSWNKKSHMIFLESPAGVGFSTCDPADLYVGDNRTSSDIVDFLVGFFEKHAELRENDFWVSGESYGGHYVPNAAKAILDYNARNPYQINLKGFAVGNPWTDAPIDNQGAADYWYSHAIISGSTHDAILNSCNFSQVGPLRSDHAAEALFGEACDAAQGKAHDEMGNINIYDIYADVCTRGAYHDGRRLLESMGVRNVPINHQPCVEGDMATYLNRDVVKKAMHANDSIFWSQCSSRLHYSRKDLLTSMLPVYRDLISRGSIRMLVFSGDVDAIVPYTGTRRWVDKLGLPVVSPWSPWKTIRGQVGGYVTKYQGLSFSTVREAGHMCPWTQPLRSLELFSAALDGSIFA